MTSRFNQTEGSLERLGLYPQFITRSYIHTAPILLCHRGIGGFF